MQPCAHLGDSIQCEVQFPFRQTIRMRLLTPDAVAYANELLMRPNSGWTLVAPGG